MVRPAAPVFGVSSSNPQDTSHKNSPRLKSYPDYQFQSSYEDASVPFIDYTMADQVDDWDDLSPYFDKLFAEFESGNVKTRKDLEKVLMCYGDVFRVHDYQLTRLQWLRRARWTDEGIKAELEHYEKTVVPKFKEAEGRLQALVLEHPKVERLPRRWRPKIQSWQNAQRFHDSALTELVAKEKAVRDQYNALSSGLRFSYDGEELTLKQLKTHLGSDDEAVRFAAWQTYVATMDDVTPKASELLDEVLAVRYELARAAGYPTYNHYRLAEIGLDYSPEDMGAILQLAKDFAPVYFDVEAELKGRDLSETMPWDFYAPEKGQEPLRPFSQNGQELEDEAFDKLFTQGLVTFAGRIHPAYGLYMEALRQAGKLDLMARDDKKPGYGFTSWSVMPDDLPGISVNGTQIGADVITGVHEVGHACVDVLAGNNMPIPFYMATSREVSELSSYWIMMLAGDHFDIFYPNVEDHQRARQSQYLASFKKAPRAAVGEVYQLWLYNQPEPPKKEEREAKFAEIMRDFGFLQPFENFASKEGVSSEDVARLAAQTSYFDYWVVKYPHALTGYAVAPFGGLQLYDAYRNAPKRTLRRMHNANRLGNFLSVEQQWKRRGLSFDFTPEERARLIEMFAVEMSRDETSDRPES